MDHHNSCISWNYVQLCTRLTLINELHLLTIFISAKPLLWWSNQFKMLVCACTQISVFFQLLHLDICQVCIMLLTGHRFPRNHISLNLFHAWHNRSTHCQNEELIYRTIIWNLSIITCSCKRLQNTMYSLWTGLSYLNHHHWQDINKDYLKGTCNAGKQIKQTTTKWNPSPVCESELLTKFCSFKLILLAFVWKNLTPKGPSEHLNSKKKAQLKIVMFTIICCHCVKFNFLKMTFISTFLTFKIIWWPSLHD